MSVAAVDVLTTGLVELARPSGGQPHDGATVLFLDPRGGLPRSLGS
jgi:hypothetical protein